MFGVFIFYQLVGIALGTSHPIDVVVSNSMKPNMNPGDLVICAKDTPKLNDVVIYTARIKDKNYPIIHRIIGINDTYCKKKIKNGTCYVIKGDNNPVADPPVSENQIVCVSKLRIPYIAYPRYIIYKILGI
ncbi:MAG: signal peptidase I [Candidatus Aenigmarchaeota archaeon ex4484_56]|nr:MAG: signal peptidase I [Candidatus Aenigmarchaeota archaeon ex4484_56]